MRQVAAFVRAKAAEMADAESVNGKVQAKRNVP
jgi:hypothetical protein